MNHEDESYLIIKRGLYYRPNSSGYTGIKDNAGRYTWDEASSHSDIHSGVHFIHEDDAPDFSEKCFDDIARDRLEMGMGTIKRVLADANERIATLEADNVNLRAGLKPFADVSAKAKGADDACWCGQNGAVIRYRDLRCAEALLSPRLTVPSDGADQ